jgi:hypothetical protein
MFIPSLTKYEFRKRLRRLRIGLLGILIYNLQILIFHFYPASQVLTSTFARNEGVALLINELSSIYFLPIAVLSVYSFIDVYHLRSYAFFRQLPFSSSNIFLVKLLGANMEFFLFSTLQYLISLVYFNVFILPESLLYPQSKLLLQTFLSSSFVFHILVLLSFNLINAIVLFFYSFFSFDKAIKPSSKVSFYVINIAIAILCLFIFNHIFNRMVAFISSTFFKNYIESVSAVNVFLAVLFLFGGAVFFSFPFMRLIDNKLDFN